MTDKQLAQTEQHLTDSLFEWRKLTFVKRCDLPEHLEFIRKQPCVIDGCKAKSTVSHLLGKGRARNKASDLLVLPMCITHHEEYEDNGIAKFELTYGLNCAKLALQYIELFIRELLAGSRPTVEIIKKQKKYQSTRKPSLAPLKKACNVPGDYNRFQPRTDYE